MARKNVVIIKDTKGNTCFVAFPKVLEQNEINKAINECNKYHQDKEQEKEELISSLVQLKLRVDKLELELALDRGEITKEEYEKELEEYGK